MRRVTRILIYHAIRSRSPVYYDARLEPWLVTGYREVQLVLGDLRFSSKGAARLSAPGRQGNDSPLAQNLARNMIRMTLQRQSDELPDSWIRSLAS